MFPCLLGRHRGNKMNTTIRTTLCTIILLSFSVAPTLASMYVGGATFVARDNSVGQLLDAGGMLCYEGTGDGVGGACLSWADVGSNQFVRVADGLADTNVAFQVCVDNNGDGLCGGIINEGPGGILTGCFDTILFSHDDAGTFYNPLGPLPTSFPPGCSGGFPGWIVFLCEGIHDDGSTTHTHPVTAGTVTATNTGSGTGTFCGGTLEISVPPKPYVVVPDGATPAEIEALVEAAVSVAEDTTQQIIAFLDALVGPATLPEIPSIP